MVAGAAGGTMVAGAAAGGMAAGGAGGGMAAGAAAGGMAGGATVGGGMARGATVFTTASMLVPGVNPGDTVKARLAVDGTGAASAAVAGTMRVHVSAGAVAGCLGCATVAATGATAGPGPAGGGAGLGSLLKNMVPCCGTMGVLPIAKEGCSTPFVATVVAWAWFDRVPPMLGC